MKEETVRANTTQNHVDNCKDKLEILNQQCKDLCRAIDQLLNDIELGNKYMLIYKQMKMYNDEDLNPVLYKSKK
jgi:2-phospho-L-lactate guanylyltransferase (CobY/MobA/RfbA family)